MMWHRAQCDCAVLYFGCRCHLHVLPESTRPGSAPCVASVGGWGSEPPFYSGPSFLSLLTRVAWPQDGAGVELGPLELVWTFFLNLLLLIQSAPTLWLGLPSLKVPLGLLTAPAGPVAVPGLSVPATCHLRLE